MIVASFNNLLEESLLSKISFLLMQEIPSSLVKELHAIVLCNSRMNKHKKQKITQKMHLFSSIHFSRPWSEIEFVIESLLQNFHLGNFVLVSY